MADVARRLRPTAPTCDCCGAQAWEYLFSESGIDLGRCSECGLHYVAQMPRREQRMTEIEAGHFAGTRVVTGAKVHRGDENRRLGQFRRYIEQVRNAAPKGKWLEIGCGTGSLISMARSEFGIDASGIELSADRRQAARKLTGATIYGEPLEHLHLTEGSFAAVMLVTVFSHLTSPAETLTEIRRILRPGGILLLVTGEIGPGVRKKHAFSWDLGDHLYFLGIGTVERYAETAGFEIVEREQVWQPSALYTRERFKVRGRSKVRDLIKLACAYTPGVLPLLRWYMLTRKHAGNPIYTSTLVLRKTP